MNIQPLIFKINKIMGVDRTLIMKHKKEKKPIEPYKLQQYQQLLAAHKAMKNYQALENANNEQNNDCA